MWNAIGNIYNIPRPFALFITSDRINRLKHATALVHWGPEQINCVLSHQQHSGVNFGFQELKLEDAVYNGAKTLLICNYPNEGPKVLSGFDFSFFKKAMSLGMNIANGLHDRLSDYPELVEYAQKCGVKLYDFRYHDTQYSLGTGLKRQGLRLATLGTDCICGKKFTSLALTKTFREAGLKVDFRSTGQSGFLISSSGINNDTVVADYLTGAAEWLSPSNERDHWDIIEGQGSILHPSFCGGTHSLLFGSQPDVMVMCHDPHRTHHLNQNTPIVPIYEQMRLCERIATYANPNAIFKAISLYTGEVPGWKAERMCASYADAARSELNREIFVFDPNKLHLPDMKEQMDRFVDYCSALSHEVKDA